VGRLNLLISGGAGSGKTTLLNALCSAVPAVGERIVAIEDASELRLEGRHAVTLEARPPNLEGLGEVTIRQLLRNALRMRPDRIVIGEIRDTAAFDFLQAINTGHAGSMCTVHANSARDALFRLEDLALLSAANMVLDAIRDQVASALDVVIHLERSEGGRRQVAGVGVVEGAGRGNGAAIRELHAQDAIAGRGEALLLLERRAEMRCGRQRAGQLMSLARRAWEVIPDGP
jgi:pilus assembly protein CpaF